MLTATSETTFGESRILSALAIDRRFRLQMIWRHRLALDTRWRAAASGDAPIASLYFALEGELEIGGRRMPLPAAFALAGEEFERVRTGADWLLSWGDPSVTLDIQLAATDVLVPVGLRHGRLTVSAATWDAVHAVADAIAIDGPLEPPVGTLLQRLVDDGIAAAPLAQAVTDEPEWVQRLWAAVRPAYSTFTSDVSLNELAQQAGISSRQIRRDAKELFEMFELYGDGFRKALHVLRLRLAVLLLSAREATLLEVAERVGYTSVEALARALRDHGLPPPSEIRDLVLYRG